MEQIGLLLGERTDQLLQAQMNRHAQGSQWSAKFMRDGRYEIVFQLVESPESRHILKNDSGANDPCARFTNWNGARQKISLSIGRACAKGLLESLRIVRSFAAEDVRSHPVKYFAHRSVHVLLRIFRAEFRSESEQSFRGSVHVGHVASHAEDDDGIGQTVDCRLHGQLSLQQFAERAVAIL